MKKFFMSLNLSMILLLLTQLALPVAYAGLVYLSPNVSLDYTTVAFIVVMEVLMFFYGWKPLVELRLAEFSFDNCADAIHKLKRVSGSSGWREAYRYFTGSDTLYSIKKSTLTIL